MTIKLFIIGRPGCGKSTAYHDIARYVQAKDSIWLPQYINDYEILLDMYKAEQWSGDTKLQRFRSVSDEGFEVLDNEVLNEALDKLNQQALAEISKAGTSTMIIIEFARDLYIDAFKRFTRILFNDAYFLYIETDVETCIQRIYERIHQPSKDLTDQDRHFVAGTTMRNYYNKDARLYIETTFKTDYAIPDNNVLILDNNVSLDDFRERVRRFIGFVLEQEAPPRLEKTGC